ncbi:cytochrome b5 reductase 4 isoform X5 [Hydra vulgaris]|uniref:Cytochrome b5 reductase 4 n=1 Tax=Hydra vulgaris TaxID=6087 RepID=A0ABM4BLX8_HYDVU
MGEALFPSPSSSQRLVRNKVALKPGRSLMHWIRFVNENKVAGVEGRNGSITLEELAKHSTLKDCWTAIRGKVYNITPYLEFHPGGIDELMKSAGIDATTIFDQVHRWVNIESMLAKCYLGPLKVNIEKYLTIEASNDDGDDKPRFDWFQTYNEVVLVISPNTMTKDFMDIERSDVIVDCSDCENLDVKVLLKDKFYHISLRLESHITFCVLKSVSTSKIEIVLTKKERNITWVKIGLEKAGHNSLKNVNEKELKFRNCQIISIEKVTHNTKLIKLKLPDNVLYQCAIGHHVILKEDIEGVEVRRSYTAVIPSLIVDDSASEEDGVIYLMVKNYPDGVLSPHITTRKEGEYLSVSESLGSFPKQHLKLTSLVYLIAAGTGLTPMIRLINHFLVHTKDCTVKLLFANRTVQDILWKDQIDSAVCRFQKRFFATYVLSEPTVNWSGLCGKINEEMLRIFLNEMIEPPKIPLTLEPDEGCSEPKKQIIPFLLDKECLIAICGPDSFTNLMKSLILSIGVQEQQIHCFIG